MIIIVLGLNQKSIIRNKMGLFKISYDVKFFEFQLILLIVLESHLSFFADAV